MKHIFTVLENKVQFVFCFIFQTVNPDVLAPIYLLQCLQGVGIHFCDVVGFCDSIKILTNRVNIHQAVVCHLNTLEVREEPRSKKRF